MRHAQGGTTLIDLSGKVFVVTGGNGGIGLGMAEGIVMAGGSIAVWGRSEEKNGTAVEQLQSLGGRAFAYVCDVSDEAQVSETMKRSRPWRSAPRARGSSLPSNRPTPWPARSDWLTNNRERPFLWACRGGETRTWGFSTACAKSRGRACDDERDG